MKIGKGLLVGVGRKEAGNGEVVNGGVAEEGIRLISGQGEAIGMGKGSSGGGGCVSSREKLK